MKSQFPFDPQKDGQEEWHRKYPLVFQSELEALKQMLPAGKDLHGIEVALAKGRFTEALGIKAEVKPSPQMPVPAAGHALEVKQRIAETLPYQDLSLDFVLMAICIRYFNDLHVAFGEAFRVLKEDGVVVTAFLDRNSIIGKHYQQHKPKGSFYRHTNFYSVEKVVFELNRAGFYHLSFCQTLFKPLDKINVLEHAKPGFGEGSFVVIQARKKGFGPMLT